MPSQRARPSSSHRSGSLIVTLLALTLIAPLVHAAATVGFVEHWTGPSTDGWGGSDFYSNPGTGGVFGAGDGYLTLTTPGPSPFFTKNLGAQSSGLEYAGNWQAAGIKEMRFWLNDIGNANPLEIHFALGDAGGENFWQYNTGFIPALGSWTQFSVDLTSAAGFTQIIGVGLGGTFDGALQNVNRVLIRHDHAPYAQGPDTISADVGVDELVLTDGTADVGPGPSSLTHAIQMAPPYPNPSHGPVVFAIESFEDAPITIQIVDAAGRIVRHASLDRAAPGPHLWTWDGTTDSGALAAPEVYRVRAFGRSGGMSRSLVRISGAR